MADIRIKDLGTTASVTASDDFMAVDGTTNGTRKLSAATPSFLTSVTTPSLTSPAATNLTLTSGLVGTNKVNFPDTLSASSATVGAVTIGNGTAATNVAIGGGNINAGGTLTVGGAATFAGAVTVATGNLIIGTAGAGIDFSATAGTGTSELLNDYEEGTWTPTLSPATTGTITVASPNLCGYTKIGRVVTVNGLIEASSVSSPVGATVNIGGLPFPSNGNTNERSVGTVRAFSLTSGALNSTATIASSTQTASLFIDASLFQAASQFYFQLTYTV